MTIILGIDVGVRECGACVLSVPRVPDPKKVRVLYGENIKADKRTHGNWVEMIFSLMLKLKSAREAQHATAVFAECPKFMGGARGQASAGRGDVVHLAFHLGMVASFARNIGATFQAIEIAQWKGTLPNDVVWSRVNSFLADKKVQFTKHTLDACGIAMCGYYKTDMRNPTFWA